MSYMREKDARSSFLAQATDQGRASLHFQAPSDAAAALLADGTLAASSLKYTHALQADGVGDLESPPGPTALIVTPDEAGGGKNVPPGNPVLTVGAPHTIATINSIGDEDFFQVTLTAGTTYEIGQYSYNAGPNGAGLTDPYIELYRADGTTLIVSADGGANTPYNDINSGFDVLLTYTPDVSGTYYVNARAFSNSPATDNGDSVGDYELFVRVQDPNDPNIYHPYYDVDEPLYAIDWGTQVNKINQSVRNPDGDEGTRDTGNAQGTPTYTSLIDIPALADDQGKDITGKNVITIYFAQEGDVFASNDPTKPGLPPATITAVAIQDFEYTAVWTSLREFEKVADVVYLEVQDQDHADFIYTSYQGTPGPGVSLLGSMSPPDESDEGLAQFNSGDERWNERDLAQGGFSFVTLIHEFGHGHGLAHPHDNGGHSGIMRGVEEESPFNYTTGDYELNQGVFTMMSYEDGWQSSPYGNADTDVGYGYLGGLSPFDIVAIQDKYGVNEDWATGNNTYRLKDVNAPGTFYYAIWDGGGTDEIVYIGGRNTNIDLRPASLIYDYGGGGWVSYAFGIYGGFTIANGVTIENASSGSGNDTLTGNNAHNHLYSGAGNDVLTGAAGSDTLNGGGGNDKMTGGTGHDIYYVSATGDQVIEAPNQGTDTIRSQISYNLIANIEDLVLIGPSNTTGRGNNLANNVTGNAGDNLLNGLAGNDVVDGGAGDDVIYGAEGHDTLTGGAGNDRFAFQTVVNGVNVDDILDYSVADNSISLANYIFTNAGPNGTLQPFAFRLGTAAGDATDRIIYDSATGSIFYDPDGMGGAAATLFATVDPGTALTHADFLIYG